MLLLIRAYAYIAFFFMQVIFSRGNEKQNYLNTTLKLNRERKKE